MQIAETPESPPQLCASASFALDLSWTLHSAQKVSLRERHRDLFDVFESRPGVEERIAGFWSYGPTCFTELEALAHLSGVLSEIDPDRVMSALESGIDRVPDRLSMVSEHEEDQLAVGRRLVSLRDERRLRRRYLALLEEIASQLSAPWLDHGLPAAAATAESITTQLHGGARWNDLVTNECKEFAAHRADINARVDAGKPLLLAVCAYFGSALYLEFDGQVVVGTGVQREDAASRARTEALAKRLKVLADPTRLAIFDYVACGPRSVSDITRAFDLAQPTVSNHVKLLREAGVVTAERRNGRTVVAADRRAVSELIDTLSAVVR